MRYRQLGRTKLKVSEISIGGGAFAGKDKKKQAIKDVIEFAFQNGINFVETAEDYGEEKIAPAIKDIRDEIILASKSFRSTKGEMKKSIRNSLKKLKTDRIEIYMLHTVNSIDGLNFRIKHGVLEALKEAKAKGEVNWIGITGHRIPVLIEAIKTNEFDVVEVPYSIGAYETEKLFDVCKEYDVGVIAIRVFGGGILLNPNKSLKRANFMNSLNALGYVLSNKSISTALIGISKVEHLKENLEALKKIDISKINRKKIEERVMKFLGKNFCRGCLACMPCKPYGWKFPIDQFLRMEVFYFKYGIESVREDYKNLISASGKCTKCKECEKNCPYKVPIVRKLEKLEKVFG